MHDTSSIDPPSLTTLLKTKNSPTELVHELVLFSLHERASDIHIHPEQTGGIIRLRIDGMLRTIARVSHTEHVLLIARLKVCAHLRTDTRKEPLDGRFSVDHHGEKYDIRISLLPTYYGESAVLRLLVRHTNTTSLQELGFSKTQEMTITETLLRQSGMILITGPTGSGKTTTLYTLLSLLPTTTLSVVTLEDPIEYALKNVKQVPIQHSLTFASGLRTIVRQDPNVIMVGEIRDVETAELSINAALTGHLLLSTLHTKDAPGALTRLLQMRIEPYLISATIALIISQRLVRILCTHCKTTHTLTDAERSYYNTHAQLPSSGAYTKPVGCEHCGGSGFYGRKIISEILTPDETLKEAISHGVSRLDIRAYIERSHMIRLWEQGAVLASCGETSLSEIFRVMNE